MNLDRTPFLFAAALVALASSGCAIASDSQDPEGDELVAEASQEIIPTIPPFDQTFSMLSKSNLKFVSASSGGAGPLVVGPAGVGPMESFRIVDREDTMMGPIVTLEARINGKYVSVGASGAGPLVADTTDPTDPEALFTWIDLGNKDFALLSRSTWRYVSVGTSPFQLILGGSTITSTETFHFNTVPAPAITVGQSYQLQNKSTTACLGVDASTSPASIVQGACTNPGPTFMPVDAGNGLVNFVSAAGLCMTLDGGGTANGTPAKAVACAGLPSQQFFVSAGASGYVRLSNPASGRCLKGSGSGAGSFVGLYDCVSTDAGELWKPTAM